MRLFARNELHIPSVPSLVLNPPISIQDALRCLSDEADLALLDSNGNGGSYLSWGSPPLRCLSLDDLVVDTGQAQVGTQATWPLAVDGGALVQIDYEFPVGTWAAASNQAGTAKIWPLKTWLHWRGEDCTLHAENDSALQAAHIQLQQSIPVLSCEDAISDALHPAWNYAQYQKHIKSIQTYIRSGDIYQVNLTMPFTAPIKQRRHLDIALYLSLREQSPAPYSAFFRSNDTSVLSHSPERFLSAHNRQCSSHPIKGTRKRIAGKEHTQRDALFHSEKDRAELAMIIDLVRNDLGRVAELGSVTVNQERQLMDLPYVHHAVGHISCKLKADVRLPDMLRACFPPGSITGAPKIRAMEIINELEIQARGAYCGCFGWIGAGHACELAVAIRCMQMDSQHIRIDAGGGIVIDSAADSEWQELNDKASAMHKALSRFRAPS